ncbi:MAG: hypothetical protein AAF699_22685, partial [Pseudomonadota bacterium]
LVGIIAPDLYRLLLSTVYQLTDDSAAAKASAGAQLPAPPIENVADRAMNVLQKLDLDAQTLESISNVLKGYHT